MPTFCGKRDSWQVDPCQRFIWIPAWSSTLQSGCDEFLTNDLQLASAASGKIKVVDWDAMYNWMVTVPYGALR